MATPIGDSERGKPRILVDCTHTFRTGASTGIQRVVRNYADALLEIAPARGFEVVPVRVQGRSLAALPLDGGRVAFPRAASARESAEGAPPRAPFLARLQLLAAHGLHKLTKSPRLARWMNASPNEDGYLRTASRLTESPARAVEPRRGDVLLCLDSSWVYDIRTALESAGRAGATRIAVLCDVLPLSQPQWFTEGTRRWFLAWIETLLPRLEGVVTISEATRTELERLVRDGVIATSAMPTSAAVHLGAELGPAAAGAIREELVQALAAGAPPALLTVGTLEPRKNVDFALDLLDELRSRGLELQWHIVGAPGWLAEHTAHRIRSHPSFGSRLRWWTDLTDAELVFCYGHAAALVAVSKAEGFGLPLVEARLHGLPAFASDIPVFREVLREEAAYLPLGDTAASADALEAFLRGDRGRKPSRMARPWRESARELLEVIERIRREDPPSRR